MTRRMGLPRRHGREGEHGQLIVVFALALVAIIAMAGLLIDGGMAWANRRQAQAAADTTALAGAVAAASGASNTDMVVAASAIATTNGFAVNYTDCGGTARTNGVVVRRGPLTGPHTGDTNFVEAITTRPMKTTFAGAVGQSCWLVSARAVASIPTQVAQCNFCSLSNWDDKYTLLLDNGNDLRIDGDLSSNHVWWYSGTEAVNRCGGTDPCTAPTCSDWNPPAGEHRIMMCGQSLYVDHSGGSTPTILSARTIATAGGWQARSENDIIHADQEATPGCYSPKNMHYSTPFLQDTNVCIGMSPIVDPLDDPSKPFNQMPPPDINALSTCPGGPFPCGPVASASCKAEIYNGLPTTLKLPTGTFTSPAKLTIAGTQGVFTICPGIYYGGFSTNGDNGSQPKVIMLPGTYVMVGGGFKVTGMASITSVSSQGDGVTIYNSGGAEAFSESFPSDPTLYTSLPCPPPAFPLSTCLGTGGTVLNPPGNAIAAGNPVTYVLSLALLSGHPKPTGTAASFTFYNGDDPIACTGGVTIGGDASHLTASCTTSYTTFGDKGITAVYAGDAVYAPTGATKTQTVDPPAGEGRGNIDLATIAGTCAPAVAPCGQIILHAPTSGRYSGLLIFQDRAFGFLQGTQGLRLEPYLGAPACDTTTATTPLGVQPAFMYYGVPPDTHPVPAPCGPLGGLSGTIYASHLATGQASDWDAVVNIRASGLANVQIIGAEINFSNLSNLQARFAFDASLFANGKIRLVE